MKKKSTVILLGTALAAACLSQMAFAGEKTQITFSHLFVEGESFHDLIQPSVDKFNAEQEDYEIIIDEMPQDAYLTQINARGTADDLSELVFVNGTMMKAFSDIGVIIPLTDVVEDIGFDQIIKPGLLADGTNIDDNVVYSLPTASGTYGFILYNQEIFDEVGIEKFPETVTEFEETCDKLIEAGYTPMGLGAKDLWAPDSLLFSAFVNNYVGNEWFNNIRKKNGEASFTDEAYLAALDQFRSFAEKGYFNEDFVSISNDERMGLYLNKKVAMVSAGDWECMNIAEADPEIAEATRAAAWPAPEDGAASKSVVQSAAWGIAMGSRITEEQKKGAELYLKDYFFTQDNGRILIEDNNEFPSWIVDEYDESKLSTAAASLQNLVSDCTACMNWDASMEPTVKEIHQRGLQEVLMQSMTPEELGEEEQAEYEMVCEE